LEKFENEKLLHASIFAKIKGTTTHTSKKLFVFKLAIAVYWRTLSPVIGGFHLSLFWNLWSYPARTEYEEAHDRLLFGFHETSPII
jgi:hypothetical protein